MGGQELEGGVLSPQGVTKKGGGCTLGGWFWGWGGCPLCGVLGGAAVGEGVSGVGVGVRCSVRGFAVVFLMLGEGGGFGIPLFPP